MKELIEALRVFDLSEKEAIAYLSLLELGEASASDIALKGNLPRTLTYDILERLIDLGLVSYAIKGRMREFAASDPHELLRILKEKEDVVNTVMPSLEKLRMMKGMARPKAEVYEGKEGMMAIMNGILRSGVKEFISYGSSRSSFAVIPTFMEDWHRERIKKKIVMKIIYNDTPQSREQLRARPASLRFVTYRFMAVTLESPTATIIYADKVVLQSWTREPFGIVVESKDMAENHIKYFEELWKIAKVV